MPVIALKRAAHTMPVTALEGVKAWARGSSGKMQPGEFSAAATQPFGHVTCCTTGFAKACQREAPGLCAGLSLLALTMLSGRWWLRCSVAFHSTSVDYSWREWLMFSSTSVSFS